MDLTSLLLRVASRRPHVLVVPTVGATAARLAVESSVSRRGWPVATGPADADIVVVAGSPGPDLAAVVERVWQQVPAPRARADVGEPADVDEELDAAAGLLADPAHQRAHAPRGEQAGAAGHKDGGPHDEGHAGHHGGHGAHAGHGQSNHGVQHDPAPKEHAGHEMHAADGAHGGESEHEAHGTDAHHATHTGHEAHAGHGTHGGHGAHAHHGHGGGMEMPGGLPMADLGDDRDGLRLDRLHVPLGPVLPDWPAGLVVHTVLQGDVIQEASAEVLDPGGDPGFWEEAHPAARELDALARFLGVVGWADAAARARRLRDELLAEASAEQVAGSVAALVRRIRRSRTLRWLVRGIPAGVTDVAGLLEQRLAAVESAVTSGDAVPAIRPTIDELADLLVGAELAAARVIVAAADSDVERAPVRREARHG